MVTPTAEGRVGLMVVPHSPHWGPRLGPHCEDVKNVVCGVKSGV